MNVYFLGLLKRNSGLFELKPVKAVNQIKHLNGEIKQTKDALERKIYHFIQGEKRERDCSFELKGLP